jgi:hypothetical protein
MAHWIRRHWAEADTWFYSEFDGDGGLTRHVELRGPLEKPVAAASLAEWRSARQDGSLEEYESKFGSLAEVFVQSADASAPESLTVEAFESVWRAARATCETRARARSPI